MSRAATEQTNIEEMLYMRGELSTREQVSGIRKSVESATNLATLLWCVKVDPMKKHAIKPTKLHGTERRDHKVNNLGPVVRKVDNLSSG